VSHAAPITGSKVIAWFINRSRDMEFCQIRFLCSDIHHFFILSCLKHLRGVSIFGRHLFQIYAVSI
jgi:hypothetical protein